MKQFERKDMTGASFKNDKRTGENPPVETMKARIGGIEYRGAAWIEKSKSGTAYKSWKFETEEDAAKKTKTKSAVPFDDPLEF
jgi:hypothetical protein